MLHATYFVVGHFHMVWRSGHVWHLRGNLLLVPQDVRTNDERDWGRSFLAQLCGHVLHLYALPLPWNSWEYPPLLSFPDDFLQPLIPVHRWITIAALITGVAQLIFLYNLIHSRFWGKPAPDNPWEGTSLEWSTATPPPFDNFGGKHPVVYHDPYQYGVQSSTGDYVMQTSPEQVKTEHDEK
jgi:cytochrome c oxidase subunit 1